METAQTIPPNETAYAASDMVLPIDEYSVKWRISRRTADRYVKNGRVQVVKKGGRTFCIDTEPEPAIDKPDRPDFADRPSDTSFDLPVKSDWIRFGIMTSQAKQANVFKALSVCLSFVLVGLVSVAVWWFILQDRRTIADSYEIRDLKASLTRTEAALITAERAGTDEKARHAARVGGLESKIEELTKINIELATTNIELTTTIKKAPQR